MLVSEFPEYFTRGQRYHYEDINENRSFIASKIGTPNPDEARETSLLFMSYIKAEVRQNIHTQSQK